MNNGPTIKKSFSCEGCKWLGKFSVIYVCRNININTTNLILGNQLPRDLRTPFWCPFLLKELRKEKLNEIYDNRRTEETIT